MKFFFDEDFGKDVPNALFTVGLKVDYVGKKRGKSGVRIGAKDVDWLARCGRLKSLVLSCNKGILSNPAERQAILENGVGIVFLTTGQEDKISVLRQAPSHDQIRRQVGSDQRFTQVRPRLRREAPNQMDLVQPRILSRLRATRILNSLGGSPQAVRSR